MNNQLKEVTLDNIAGGAAVELFERELEAVTKNIADINTDPKKARKINITVTLKPEENREEIKMSVSACSVLASVKPASRILYLGKLDGKPKLYGNNPHQTSFEFNSPNVTTIKGAQNA